MKQLTKWNKAMITEHLQYLDTVKTKWPHNIKTTKIFWQEQLEKLKQNEQRHKSQST